MPIYWFALLIMVLYSASAPMEEAYLESPFVTALGLVMLWAITGKMLALSAAKRVIAGEDTYVRAFIRFRSQLEFLRWIWLPLGAVGLNIAGLSDRVQDLMWVQDSMCLKASVLLLPSAVMLSTLWIAERHYMDWADGRNGLSESKAQGSLMRFVFGNFRLQCAWLFLPVLTVLLVIDVCELGFSLSENLSPLASGLIGLTSLPLLLPLLLCWIWPTERLSDDDDAAWVNKIVAGAGCRGLHVRKWNTSGRVCTALVAGFFPRFRVLMITDALIDRLAPSELTMVTLHELAHVRRYHMLARLLALIPAWLIAHGVSLLMTDVAYTSLVSAGIGVLLSAVALCLMSHITEYDADRVACKLAERLPDSANRLTAVRAARSLALALSQVSGNNPKADKASWMHPSLSSRIRRLNELAASSILVSDSLELVQSN